MILSQNCQLLEDGKQRYDNTDFDHVLKTVTGNNKKAFANEDLCPL